MNNFFSKHFGSPEFNNTVFSKILGFKAIKIYQEGYVKWSLP